VHAGQGNEPAAVVRPAFEDRKPVEVEVIALNHFLAGGVFGVDGLGESAGQRAQLGQHLELAQ